jgi:cytosine/adenosine deaminase-related metal-dependent hydrolase
MYKPGSLPEVIYKAKWVLPITSDPIPGGEVLVIGDHIEAVGRKLSKSHPEEPAIDLGEAILAPGFVNVHAHLDYTALRGSIDDLPLFPWVRKVTEYAQAMEPTDYRWSSLLGAAECARAGITTVADASPSAYSLDALLQSGLRGIVYQEVFGYRSDDFAPDLDGLEARLDSLVPKATERVKVGVSPHAIYTVSPGLLAAVRELARQAALPISIHIAESPSEYEFCVSGTGEIARLYHALGIAWVCPGVSPVQYLYDLGILGPNTTAAHCVQVDDNDIHILGVTRTGVAHCPRSNAKLSVGTAPISAMLQLGLRLGLGTDSAVSSGTLDICEEAKFAVHLQRAVVDSPGTIDARSMVQAATIGGAQALNMDGDVGSIEQGKKADLVAIDVSAAKASPGLDPYSTLVYGSSGSDVILTLVDGEVIYDRLGLKTLDLNEIMRNACKTAVRLRKEVGS